MRTGQIYRNMQHENVVMIAEPKKEWKGRFKTYPPLYPSKKLLNEYWRRPKETRDRWYYYKYREQLEKLNPQRVYNDLKELVGEEAILCCYEPPYKPCHRRIVAEWLEEELGIEIPEKGFENTNYPSYLQMVAKEENRRKQMKLF